MIQFFDFPITVINLYAIGNEALASRDVPAGAHCDAVRLPPNSQPTAYVGATWRSHHHRRSAPGDWANYRGGLDHRSPFTRSRAHSLPAPRPPIRHARAQLEGARQASLLT